MTPPPDHGRACDVLPEQVAKAVAGMMLRGLAELFEATQLLLVITLRTSTRVQGVTNGDPPRGVACVIGELGDFEPHGELVAAAGRVADEVCEGTGWTCHVLIADQRRGRAGWADSYSVGAPREDTELEHIRLFWERAREAPAPPEVEA